MAIETLNPFPPSQHAPHQGHAPAPAAPAPAAAPAPPPPNHQPPHTTVTTLQRETPDAQGSWSSYLLIIGLLGVLVTLVLAGRYLYVRQQITSFSATINTLRTEYAGLQSTEDKANDIKVVADALSTVYQSQLNYTGLLKKLEETTFNGVRYVSLSLDDQGQVVLSGRVASYLDFAKTVKAFKEKGVTDAITNDVVISSVGQELTENPDGTRTRVLLFSVSFTLEDSLLQPAHASPLTSNDSDSSFLEIEL